MIQRVEVGRSLDPGVVSDLAATLSEQIGRGVDGVHLDASRVVEFDSQSLESIVDFAALCRSRGLAFVLVDPSELLEMALTITGLRDRMQLSAGEDLVASAPVGDDGEDEA